MKTPKAITSLALAGCLLLSACGAGGSSSTGSAGSGSPNAGANNTNSGGDTGRYVESIVTPPLNEDDFSAFLLREETGNLISFNDDLTQRFDSADGGLTWAQSEGPGAGIPGIGWYNSLTLLSDGSILATVTTEEAMENMTYESSLLLIKADGTTENFAFEGVAGDGYYSALVPLPDGKVFVSHTSYGNLDVSTNVMQDGSPEESGEQPEEVNAEAEQPVTQNVAGEVEAEVPENSGAVTATDGLDGDEPAENDDENDEDAQGNQVFGGGEATETNAIFDGTTGAKITDVMVDTYAGVVNATYGSGKLYVMDYEGNANPFGLDGKRLNEEAPAFPLDFNGMSMGSMSLDGDGNMYYASPKGIYAVNDGGVETLIDGSGYSFSDPNVTLESMLALGDGSFLLRAYGGEGYQFYRYDWDPNAAIDESKVINVWALQDSNTVRSAIGRWREKYPDGQVNLEVALDGTGGMTATDAIRNLNTEILSGNGPDVVILDGAPLDSYIDKGTLLDMNGLVDTGTYYENLLEQVKEDDGAMYYVPMRVTVPVLAANEGYLTDSIDDFIDMMKQAPAASGDAETNLDFRKEDERSLIAYQNLNELWEYMWAANAPAVISGTELNEANLRKLLEYVKEISDYNGYSTPGAEEDYTLMGGMMFSAGGTAATSIEGSLMAQMMGSSNSSMFIAGDVMTLNYLRDATTIQVGNLDEGQNADKGSDFGLLPAIQTGVWTPSVLAGINAGSQKQEAAIEFVNLMLSDTVQGSRLTDGFAVTQSGMQAQIDDLKQYFEFDSGNMGVEDFNALFQNLTTMNLVDNEVGGKIYEYAIPYVQGAISLDDAIDSIQRDIKNYLAERQ